MNREVTIGLGKDYYLRVLKQKNRYKYILYKHGKPDRLYEGVKRVVFAGWKDEAQALEYLGSPNLIIEDFKQLLKRSRKNSELFELVIDSFESKSNKKLTTFHNIING